MKFQRRRIRLKDFNYLGTYGYFITICTHDKHTYFKDTEIPYHLIPLLKSISEKFGFLIYAYCFMPDHLHLVVEGKNGNSDLIRFIKEFKQISSFEFKKISGFPLWQKSFYDHVLRKDEDLLATSRYAFENPCRKGIVQHFKDYPFSGSFTFDIKNL